jgi:hypothetical protein
MRETSAMGTIVARTRVAAAVMTVTGTAVVVVMAVAGRL